MSDASVQSFLRFQGAAECRISRELLFPGVSAGYCRLLYIWEGKGALALPSENRGPYAVDSHCLLFQRDAILQLSTATYLRLAVVTAECFGGDMPSFAVHPRPVPDPETAMARAVAGEGISQQGLEKLVELACHAPLANMAVQPASAEDPARMLKTILDTRYAESLHLDDFSRQLYFNKFRLLREFKKKYGIPPIEYLLRRRIAVAAGLLRDTSLKVWEIGNQVGLSNPAYFTRAFCSRMGCTPAVYRTRCRGQEDTDGE